MILQGLGLAKQISFNLQLSCWLAVWSFLNGAGSPCFWIILSKTQCCDVRYLSRRITHVNDFWIIPINIRWSLGLVIRLFLGGKSRPTPQSTIGEQAVQGLGSSARSLILSYVLVCSLSGRPCRNDPLNPLNEVGPSGASLGSLCTCKFRSRVILIEASILLVTLHKSCNRHLPKVAVFQSFSRWRLENKKWASWRTTHLEVINLLSCNWVLGMFLYCLRKCCSKITETYSVTRRQASQTALDVSSCSMQMEFEQRLHSWGYS